jgi:cytochrome c-type biogenesis protein
VGEAAATAQTEVEMRTTGPSAESLFQLPASTRRMSIARRRSNLRITALGTYGVVDTLDSFVSGSLGTGTASTAVLVPVVLATGILTSFSPCTLSVLPLTIGYIGGYDRSQDTQDISLVWRSGAFAAGLATTLSGLGLISVSVGKAYGQIGGPWLAIGVSGVAIAMGLSLLEVIIVPFPSLDIDTNLGTALPLAAKSYIAGLTFALIASPCSTPVLATLLAYVSTTDDYLQGGLLLFAYALGYVAPLMAAALFTDSVKRIMSVRKFTAWVTPASGVFLVAGGTYGILSRLF